MLKAPGFERASLSRHIDVFQSVQYVIIRMNKLHNSGASVSLYIREFSVKYLFKGGNIA